VLLLVAEYFVVPGLVGLAFASWALSLLGPRASVSVGFAVATSALLVALVQRSRSGLPRAGATAAVHLLVWACVAPLAAWWTIALR